jgi:hypothetical protein
VGVVVIIVVVLTVAVATGAGSEVQRPLATVVIGGLTNDDRADICSCCPRFVAFCCEARTQIQGRSEISRKTDGEWVLGEAHSLKGRELPEMALPVATELILEPSQRRRHGPHART